MGDNDPDVFSITLHVGIAKNAVDRTAFFGRDVVLAELRNIQKSLDWIRTAANWNELPHVREVQTAVDQALQAVSAIEIETEE